MTPVRAVSSQGVRKLNDEISKNKKDVQNAPKR
jgi:hypothetical protein